MIKLYSRSWKNTSISSMGNYKQLISSIEIHHLMTRDYGFVDYWHSSYLRMRSLSLLMKVTLGLMHFQTNNGNSTNHILRKHSLWIHSLIGINQDLQYCMQMMMQFYMVTLSINTSKSQKLQYRSKWITTMLSMLKYKLLRLRFLNLA